MVDCVFCKIILGEIPSDKIMESDNFVVIRDAFPKVKGHSLVISKKHFGSFMEIDSSLGSEMVKLVQDFAKSENWSDFNLVTNQGKAAGQIVEHLHFHVLPRKDGDSFSLGV